MNLGIDISNNNGAVNVAALKKSHPELVTLGLKATESNNFHDAYFQSNWAQALKAGLVPMPYHFARPETHRGQTGGALEAIYFLNDVAHYLGQPGAGRPVLDYETVNDPQYVLGFVKTLRKAGFEPVVYVSGSKVPEITAVEPHIDLWVAAYGVSSYTQYTHAHPGRVVMWQYTDKLDGKYDASHVLVSPNDLQIHGKQPKVVPIFEEIVADGKMVFRVRKGKGRLNKYLASSKFAKLVAKSKHVLLRRKAGPPTPPPPPK